MTELNTTYQRDEWIQAGIKAGHNYLIIMQDLEDKECFPVYFEFYSDTQRYLSNVISETKSKFIDLIKLSAYDYKK